MRHRPVSRDIAGPHHVTSFRNPNLFVMMYTRNEAVLSSQIEGTQASISDLLKAEADLFNVRPSRDVSEVRNYVAAMNLGLQRLPDLPISIRLIKEIHGRLMLGVRGHHQQSGETRRSQNWIGPSGSTILGATYIPPHIEAEQALGELEKFIHASDHLPLLIRIGLIHAQFETIHPFLDGNGRIGRLLITLFLCSKHILQGLFYIFLIILRPINRITMNVCNGSVIAGIGRGGLSSSFKEWGLLQGKQRKQREKLWLSEKIIDSWSSTGWEAHAPAQSN
jgi:Fic family protein